MTVDQRKAQELADAIALFLSQQPQPMGLKTTLAAVGKVAAGLLHSIKDESERDEIAVLLGEAIRDLAQKTAPAPH